MERLEYLCSFSEVADTNVEAVFDLILDAAVRGHVPQQELPEALYLISDMEFNACVRDASLSNFENARRRFAEHGYTLPQIVFWNVASRHDGGPGVRAVRGDLRIVKHCPKWALPIWDSILAYSVVLSVLTLIVCSPGPHGVQDRPETAADP